MVTENVEIEEYKIRNDHMIQFNIYALHHNMEEWKEHDKYIPERFDPKSEYFLRPDGNKRNKYSFGPFLGGKRICPG